MSCPNLDSRSATYGPALAGVLVSSMFAGVLYNQTISFFYRFRADSLHHKIIVAALGLNSLLAWATGWVYLWQNVLIVATFYLSSGPTLYILFFVTNAIASLLSQSFFMWRAYQLWGRSKWLGATFLFLLLLYLALALWFIVSEAAYPDQGLEPIGALPKSTFQLVLPLCISAGADLITTISLAWSLQQRRGRASNRTELVLMRLIRQSVTTGAITSLSTTLTAILYALTADSNTKVGGVCNTFWYILPQTTALVVLGTLNMRTPADTTSAIGDSDFRKESWGTEGIGRSTGSEGYSVPFAPSARFQHPRQGTGKEAYALSARSPITSVETDGTNSQPRSSEKDYQSPTDPSRYPLPHRHDSYAPPFAR